MDCKYLPKLVFSLPPGWFISLTSLSHLRYHYHLSWDSFFHLLFFFFLQIICVCFQCIFVSFCCFFFFSPWPLCTACGILVPQTGIEPRTPAMETWSLNHWTAREVLCLGTFEPSWAYLFTETLYLFSHQVLLTFHWNFLSFYALLHCLAAP